MDKQKNKKGQLMALYLPIMTLFMVFLVIAMYWVQNSGMDSHMVSSAKVLGEVDWLQTFEVWEDRALLEVVNKSKTAEEMREEFCGGFSDVDFVKGFFRELVVGGIKSSSAFDSSEERKSFCLNEVYEFKVIGNNLQVIRMELEKSFRLAAQKTNKINFVVDVDWKIPSKEYVLNLEGAE